MSKKFFCLAPPERRKFHLFDKPLFRSSASETDEHAFVDQSLKRGGHAVGHGPQCGTAFIEFIEGASIQPRFRRLNALPENILLERGQCHKELFVFSNGNMGFTNRRRR